MNPTLLFLCLLLSTPVLAQCDKYVLFQDDKLSGKQFHSSPYIIIPGKYEGQSLKVLMQRHGKHGVIQFNIIGSQPCVDKGDKLLILFEDDTRAEILNQGDYNCKGNFSLYYKNISGSDDAKELAQKNIKAMRIFSSDYSMDAYLTDENKEAFQQALSCLIKM